MKVFETFIMVKNSTTTEDNYTYIFGIRRNALDTRKGVKKCFI